VAPKGAAVVVQQMGKVSLKFLIVRQMAVGALICINEQEDGRLLSAPVLYMNQAKDAADEPGAKGPATTREKAHASPDDNQLDIDLGRHLTPLVAIAALSAQSILLGLEDGRQQRSKTETRLAKLPQRDPSRIGFIVGLKRQLGGAFHTRPLCV